MNMTEHPHFPALFGFTVAMLICLAGGSEKGIPVGTFDAGWIFGAITYLGAVIWQERGGW